LAKWQTNSSWYQRRRKRLLSVVEFAGSVNYRRSLAFERTLIPPAQSHRPRQRAGRLSRLMSLDAEAGGHWNASALAAKPKFIALTYQDNSSHLPR
jgi:hypothetical protein